MNLDSVKAKFLTYLEKEGKIEENDTRLDNGDISIFMYANEFKTYLQNEYTVTDGNILSKSISDILDMEITETGELIDPEELEAYDKALENLNKEGDEEDFETGEEQDKGQAECKDEANCDDITTEIRADLESELNTKIPSGSGEDIVKEFDSEIAETVESEINAGEIEEYDIFNEVFNNLLKDDKFRGTIDSDKTGDINKEEFTQFIGSIKGFDDNENDVSVNDLLSAAVQIGNNEFEFISIQKPQTSETESTKPERKPDNSIEKDTNKTTDTQVSIPAKDNITDSSDCADIGGTQTDSSSLSTGETATNVSTIDSANSSSNLESMTGELESLQAEKSDTEADLDTQTSTYNNAQCEKESTLGQIDGEIDAGKANLDCANKDVETTCAAKTSAENDLDTAAKNLSCGQATLEDKDCGVKQAQEDTCNAQSASDTANVNNQDAIAAEEAAQTDSDNAGEALNTATDNTGAAQVAANAAGVDLAAATVSADEAFSVLNLKNQEVAQAQSEYNNAQAQANNASESLWQKFMNWVNDAWNFLSDAIAQRDHAQAEAEREAAKQKEAQIASDEALAELEKREEEQADAQNVLDQANVVLDRATGEREVSDQEYAESLVLLADAMESEEMAVADYNTAFDNYMQLNDYHADAEGRLQDAQGNYISATQVAEEFTTYIQGLMEQRSTQETKYDGIIVTTAAVIAGDQEKISDLDSQINQLTKEIEEEERNIALQETMITALANDQSQLNAAKSSAGFIDNAVALFGGGNTAEQNAINDKKSLLEKALLSGDTEEIKAAYKAIYGDEEVYFDENGKIVLGGTETDNLTSKKVSELSDEDLDLYMNNSAQETVNAADTVSMINEGTIVYNGKEITMAELNEMILTQVDATETDMNNAVERQGNISKFGGAINNVIGIGTSEVEARAQVDSYQQLAADLNNCTDPIEYAALYKEITGQEFNIESICKLLAYSEVKTNQDTKSNERNSGISGGTGAGRSDITSTTETTGKTEETKQGIDLTASVSELSNEIINNYDSNADALSFRMDSKAQETIQDYKETQSAIKDGVIGVASGVVSTVVVTACTAAGVCAAPFTAGASLGMIAAGFAIAGTTGAAVSTGLNAYDSIYDADGDGKKEFNYTLKEAGKDATIGFLSGVTGNLANGAGAAVTRALTTSGETALATTTATTMTQTYANMGTQTLRQTTARYAGYAVEGYIDGAISSGGQYAIDAAFDSNIDFSFEQMLETSSQGGTFGMFVNTGLNATQDLASNLYYKNLSPLDNLNQFDPEMRYDAIGDGSDNQRLMLGDGSQPGDADGFKYTDGNSPSGSGANPFDSNTNVGTTATSAASNTTKNIDFNNLSTEISRGNKNPADVLNEVIGVETNTKILNAYAIYLNNPTQDTLNKLRRALQNKYHPDINPAYSNGEASSFYNLIIDELSKTV